MKLLTCCRIEAPSTGSASRATAAEPRVAEAPAARGPRAAGARTGAAAGPPGAWRRPPRPSRRPRCRCWPLPIAIADDDPEVEGDAHGRRAGEAAVDLQHRGEERREPLQGEGRRHDPDELARCPRRASGSRWKSAAGTSGKSAHERRQHHQAHADPARRAREIRRQALASPCVGALALEHRDDQRDQRVEQHRRDRVHDQERVDEGVGLRPRRRRRAASTDLAEVAQQAREQPEQRRRSPRPGRAA